LAESIIRAEVEASNIVFDKFRILLMFGVTTKVIYHNLIKIMEEYDLQIIKMLEEKQKEMIDFIAICLRRRNRIGHDIIDIMPSRADIATIKLDNLIISDNKLGDRR
jgi:hypothetical protein